MKLTDKHFQAIHIAEDEFQIENNTNSVIRVDAEGGLICRHFLDPGEKISLIKKCKIVTQVVNQKNYRSEASMRETDKIPDLILKMGKV